jgi:hypothetical protein
VKKQHHVRCSLAAAPCDRPRIGLFAQGGIVRDWAWQGDSLYVFSQESIGNDAVLRQLLSHERVIVASNLEHRRLRHR